MKKICVITGTRAEYGQLSYLLKKIEDSNKLQLQLVVTGMHLSPEFGLTYKAIENDGFKIDRKIEMVLSADTPSSISKSTAVGLIGFADAFNELAPDLVVLLGDRYEIFAACTAAFFAKIPISHIAGGETTSGAFDEAIRHSITKMAYWHFVANKSYERRVVQLGEDPKRVFNVGALAVDSIKRTRLLSKNKLVDETGIKFGEKNLIITYHPVTLDYQSSEKDMEIIFEVLNSFKDINLIFTMPNADTNGRILKTMILDYVKKNPGRSQSFNSLGSTNYLSALQYVDGVLGNSSSGLSEAPSFKIGTINIGDRQKGRIRAKSIIDCKPNKSSISQAIKKLYSQKFQKIIKNVKNPLGMGNSTNKILDTFLKKDIPRNLKKDFYDL